MIALLPAGPAVVAVRWATESPAVHAVVEAEIDVRATFTDAFDPDDVSVDATIVAPDGTAMVVPGFWSQPFKRRLEGKKEVVEPAGPAGWRVRWSPLQTGAHKISVRIRDASGLAESPIKTLTAVPGDGPEIVGVAKNDPAHFAIRGSEKSFWPLGLNLGWADEGGSYSMDDWIGRLGANGGNWARVWLAPGWCTFGFETKDGGVGKYELDKLWRLDQALAKARASGVRLQLCIQSYNDLRDRDASNEWERSPWNAENKGPLRIWSDYWESPVADKLMKRKLRYLVGRYAADPSVFAWEFWNEVDLTRDYRTDRVRAWHARMAAELTRLDPYRHLKTTSYSRPNGDREVDTLPGLDFVQTHSYGEVDPAAAIVGQHARKLSWGKPHFAGEVGADGEGPRAAEDPKGVQIHDPLWAAIGSGMAGGAGTWWWDSYVAPRNLFTIYKGASRFLKGVDFPSEGFKLTDTDLRYARNAATPRTRDLILANGERSWEPSLANRPTVVVIDRRGKARGRPAGLLHGKVNHPQLQNPVQFRLDLVRATTLEIVVGDVSGYGGAALAVEVDGARVMNKSFPDPDGNAKTTTLRQYAGVYRVLLPAGRHTVDVGNPGRDWVTLEYRLKNVVTTLRPPLDLWAVAGERTAMAWIRLSGRTWKAVASKTTPPPFDGAILSLPGLAAGKWRVEFWDTWTGKIIRSESKEVRMGGVLRTLVPTITTDLALKAVRL